MESIEEEFKDISVEEGSNKQAFKTMVKMTCRIHYIKNHLLGVLIEHPKKYKILYDSMQSDEVFINTCRGVLGLPKKFMDV